MPGRDSEFGNSGIRDSGTFYSHSLLQRNMSEFRSIEAISKSVIGKGANRQVGRRSLDPEFFREVVCMEGEIY